MGCTKMHMLLLMCLGGMQVNGAPTGIKIGILCDTDVDSWQYLFDIASAMSIGIDDLTERGIIQNSTISR